MADRTTIKVRELRTRLGQLGCERHRGRGSHEVWRTPRGGMLVLVVNHLGTEVSATVLASTRHTLRAEGLDLDERPPRTPRGPGADGTVGMVPSAMAAPKNARERNLST